VTFDSKENIPLTSVRGIYFLFDGKDIVYVGQSVNMNYRVGQHVVSDKEFDSWNYVEIKAECLDEYEAEYIMHLQPKYNKAIPKNTIWHSIDAVKRKSGVGKLKLRKIIKELELECTNFNSLLYIKNFPFSYGGNQ
jgi:hypothetical protein